MLLVRGGLNEVFRLFWSQKEDKRGIMFYLDKNAAYCFLAMINYFPIGSYEILTFYDLKNVIFNGTQFERENGKLIYGVALVRILCPPNLLIPFISYRSLVSERNTIPCCKSCADLQSPHCSHSKRYDSLQNFFNTFQ